MAAIAITAASFLPSIDARIVQGKAGAAITRGQSLYYDAATASYKLFDADDTTKDQFFGLACVDVGADQQMLVCYEDPALVLGGTLVTGDTVWGSPTPGGVTKTIADLASLTRVWSLGVATSSTVMNFKPVRGGIK